MSEARPVTLATLAPVVFSLLIGGVLGIYIDKYSATSNRSTAAAGSGGSGRGATSGGPGGGMGGGMGGGGGASQPNSGRTLARLVGSLATVEKLQGKGLTADQQKKLVPILKEIKDAPKLPEAEAKSKLDAVNAVLTSEQTQLIADMTPARGGRGGGGGGGMMGGGGGMGGMMGGAPPGSGGAGRPGSGGGAAGGGGRGAAAGGGGGQADPDKPFASERSKKALDDLIGALKGS